MPTPAAADLETTYIVNASALRLRASASAKSDVLASLPRGTAVQLLAEDGSWSMVQAGKRIGWMATKYLTPGESPLAPTSLVEEFGWMTVALAEVGVREKPGRDVEGRIAVYQESTELDRNLAASDERPWCSDFVNFCVERAGLAGTNSAAARSWLGWGREIAKPRRGAITVLSRGKLGAHVAFYVGRGPGKLVLRLLGGNQGNSVCVADYDVSRLLGYRIPLR